jgi:hypothetical protein
VASWLGRNASGFSVGAASSVHGWSATIGKGVGRGCQRAGGTVPCTGMHGTGPAHARVYGNTGLSLGALGGLGASEWHDHCAAQGGSKVAASRGIGHALVDELDGEVTGREVVGAALPMLGAHGGHGDIQGSVGCSCSVSVRWGRCWGVSRAAPKHWGSMAVG